MINKTELSRISSELSYYGCNPRESEIYVLSLQVGPASVAELAKKLGHNRVTVHSAIEQLIRKGFLCETRKGKRRLIVAEPPNVLSRILQKKENELKLMHNGLESTVAMLDSLQVADGSIPAVKLYEEVDGFKRMLEETLSAQGEVLVFTYVDLFSKLLEPEYLEDYFARRSAKGIHTRLIFPPCSFANRVNRKAKQYKIQIRLLPEELKWRSGIFAWNDSLAIKSFTQGKLTCTIIENADIADFFRNVIFELSWQTAKPIGVATKS